MRYAFRIGRGHAGLSFTDPNDYTAPPWRSWETSRCGAVGVDFGSDGVAHARSHQLKHAVERLRDQSHINNRVVYIPIPRLVATSPRIMDPSGRTWERVRAATRQPVTIPSASAVIHSNKHKMNTVGTGVYDKLSV